MDTGHGRRGVIQSDMKILLLLSSEKNILSDIAALRPTAGAQDARAEPQLTQGESASQLPGRWRSWQSRGATATGARKEFSARSRH
jgi:hypothetical protein